MQLVKTTITNHTNGFLRMETSHGFEDIQVDPKSSRTYPFDLFTILPEIYHQGLLEAVKKGEYDITVAVTNAAAEYGLVVEGNQDEEVRWMKEQVSKDLATLKERHKAELTKRCNECAIRKEWIKLSDAAKADKPAEASTKASESPKAPDVPAPLKVAEGSPPAPDKEEVAKAPAKPEESAAVTPPAGGFSQWNKTAKPTTDTKPKGRKPTK